jgi:hypothetical protein
MKKSTVLFALFFLGFIVSSLASVKPGCYVKTSDAIYFGQKLKIGLLNTKILSDDGKVVKIANQDITAYQDGSKVFELNSLVGNDPESPNKVMMELISVRSDFKLFCYENNESLDSHNEYYVYQNGKLTVRINPANAQSVFGFFGLNAR